MQGVLIVWDLEVSDVSVIVGNDLIVVGAREVLGPRGVRPRPSGARGVWELMVVVVLVVLVGVVVGVVWVLVSLSCVLLLILSSESLFESSFSP